MYALGDFSNSPSKFKSIFGCLNGNMRRSKTHERNIITATYGTITIIHCPKPIPPPKPPCSFRYFSAMAFGGVPMGVPIPPILAAIGIASTKAAPPLPLSCRGLSIGAITANIMAVVAVLLINIENVAVTSIIPSKTISEREPKGLNIILAKFLSREHLPAPIARKNPPINSMIIGSAKVAIIAL